MGEYQVRAGVDTYLLYGEETTYGTEASTIQSVFGSVTAFNPSIRRNLVKVRGTNGVLPSANTAGTARDPHAILPGVFEGDVSVTFNPFDFRFLTYVFGSESGAGTAASVYNYPQASAATDSDKKKYLKVPSISLSTNYRFGGSGDTADSNWTLLGGKVDSCSISANIGEPVSVNLGIPIADIKQSGTLQTAVANPSNDVYHFTGVSMEYPASSSLANVFEQFTLDITNGITVNGGLGQFAGQYAKEGERDFSLKVTLTAEGKEFFDDFMGGTTLAAPVEIATIKLTLTGDTNKELNIFLKNCKIDEPNLSNDYPTVVKETLTIHPEFVYVTEQTSA